MSSTAPGRAGEFTTREIMDRQMNELVGMARGMIADGHLNDAEVHFLRRWLAAGDGLRAHPLVTTLLRRIEDALADGHLSEEERADLHDTLVAFTGSDFELGEVLKSSTLPLCSPAPSPLQFKGMRYCLTGTFVFGQRDKCEAEVLARGGTVGSLAQRTNVLVIGEYATAAWKQSAFGRKIEQAVEWRAAGVPISIVSEPHWRSALGAG